MRAFDVSPKRLILRAMTMDKHRIFTTELSKVYPLYVQKAERKNRTKDEVDQIICQCYRLTDALGGAGYQRQSPFMCSY
jgi:hypothetical protein